MSNGYPLPPGQGYPPAGFAPQPPFRPRSDTAPMQAAMPPPEQAGAWPQAGPGPGPHQQQQQQPTVGRITFHHMSGRRHGQVDDVAADRVGLGRDPEHGVAFDPDEVEVSGNHAHLWRAQDGYYYLVDCGSRNGTFLNGQPVADTVPVVPGSVIRLGATGPEVGCYYHPWPCPTAPPPPRYG